MYGQYGTICYCDASDNDDVNDDDDDDDNDDGNDDGVMMMTHAHTGVVGSARPEGAAKDRRPLRG